MIFHRVVRAYRRVVAVFPWPVGEVESAHRRDDLLAEHGIEGLVVGVPYGDARVIPVVAHPFAVFAYHLIGVEADLVFGTVPSFAGPNEILVLDQQSGFVCDVEPLLGRWTDAEAE